MFQIRYSGLQHWLIPKFEDLQTLQGRKSLQAILMQRWNSVQDSHMADVRRTLLSLFGSWYWTSCVTTSGIDVRQAFAAGATAWANAEHDCHVWLLPLRGFPGPPKGISSWPYTWCHATDLKGLLGMMSVGKVLRSATDQVGLDPSSGQYSFSFSPRFVTSNLGRMTGNIGFLALPTPPRTRLTCCCWGSWKRSTTRHQVPTHPTKTAWLGCIPWCIRRLQTGVGPSERQPHVWTVWQFAASPSSVMLFQQS